jgi:hypothetical protein
MASPARIFLTKVRTTFAILALGLGGGLLIRALHFQWNIRAESSSSFAEASKLETANRGPGRLP